MRLIIQEILDSKVIDLNEFKRHFLLKRKETDEYLQEILDLAIEAIERRTNLSIRKKKWKLTHNNCCINLIKGPIRNIISIEAVDTKQEISPLKIFRNGDDVAILLQESVGTVSVTYEAGYNSSNLPICLKNSIIEMFWNLYEFNEAKITSDNDLIISDSQFDYSQINYTRMRG